MCTPQNEHSVALILVRHGLWVKELLKNYFFGALGALLWTHCDAPVLGALAPSFPSWLGVPEGWLTAGQGGELHFNIVVVIPHSVPMVQGCANGTVGIRSSLWAQHMLQITPLAHAHIRKPGHRLCFRQRPLATNRLGCGRQHSSGAFSPIYHYMWFAPSSASHSGSTRHTGQGAISFPSPSLWLFGRGTGDAQP